MVALHSSMGATFANKHLTMRCIF